VPEKRRNAKKSLPEVPSHTRSFFSLISAAFRHIVDRNVDVADIVATHMRVPRRERSEVSGTTHFFTHSRPSTSLLLNHPIGSKSLSPSPSFSAMREIRNGSEENPLEVSAARRSAADAWLSRPTYHENFDTSR